MASKIPYVAQPGTVAKILSKAKAAQTPDRFTQDFLETKLGCRGGNYRQFIPLAKRCGLLNTDGTPTDLYKKFRNPSTSGAAIAQAMRIGYHELFERNEYANSLDREKLKGLIVEITGLEAKNKVVQLTLATCEALKGFADFDKKLVDSLADDDSTDETPPDPDNDDVQERDFDLRLSYTINLVLPKSEDPAVFNAIFRALRENLLRK
jgi:hypothetical protein